MSLANSTVNQTYTASMVALGNVSTNGTSDVFTQSKTLSEYAAQFFVSNASAQITSYSAATSAITVVISGTAFGSPQSTTVNGTVLANDANSFLLNGTIFGQNGNVLVSNLALPGDGATVQVPLESQNIVYTPACYCAGTLIRTARGDVAVEQLAIGDLLPTVSGGVEPIVWIGARSYAGRFLAGNDHLQPVRFRAGSLGENAPTRDLLVSRKHAMLIDGVLVPAEQLVNGTTIVDERMGRVDYFHIELARHAAIWAEGAASETFVDDGSRGVFHNAHESAALQPGFVAGPVRYCAPRVEQGVEVDAIRARTGAILLDEAA